MAQAMTASMQTIDGCAINVQRAGGAGPVLLFLHGAGGGMWLPFLDDLAGQFRVIAPEHPGFGASETPGWLDNIHDMALFYLDFLAREDLCDVHVVGHSLGGWLAAEMAMFDATRLASLTLVSSAGIHLKGVPKGDLFMWSAEEAVRNAVHDPAVAERLLAAAAAAPASDVPLKNRYMTARLGWQPRFYDPLLMKWLSRVRLPTHIIWGEDDKIFPVAYASGFKEILPQSQVTVLPECGHLPQVERPQAFVAEVGQFIAGARS